MMTHHLSLVCIFQFCCIFVDSSVLFIAVHHSVSQMNKIQTFSFELHAQQFQIP